MTRSGPADGVLSFDDAALAGALLGRGLPAAAEEALRFAAACHADDARAEAYLKQAQSVAPDHAAVLIGLYRYHFYKNQLQEAVIVAMRCLTKAARDIGLNLDWRRVRPSDAAFGDYGAPLARFYLFALKGYAYLRLRVGDHDEGRDAALKLLELDPTDKINARLLLDVLNRAEHADDE